MRKIFVIIFVLLGMGYILLNPSNVTEEIITNNNTFITIPNKLNNVSKNIYTSIPNYKKIFEKTEFYFENNNFYNNIIGLVATNTKKIIDVSSYQGDIDWNLVKNEIDGVILRIGFGSNTLDSKFERNINEVKRLNIPYGIYLYSYAENKKEALEEAKYVESLIKKYDLKPTLGIYYDIEEFYIGGKKINILPATYQKIIETFIKYLKKYDVSVYSYAKMYKYKFNKKTKKYVTWIAQYNYSFKDELEYNMWQYSDKGKINGINGNVDMNVMFNKE